MEDPIKFHLWAKVKAPKRAEALSFVRYQDIFANEIELRKAISRSVMNQEFIQISSAHGYSATLDLMNKAEAMFTEVSLCQENYAPAEVDSTAYCAKHHLHFGGCLGCHICSGRYAA